MLVWSGVVMSVWCRHVGVVSSCQCGVVMLVWCRHVGVEWCRHVGVEWCRHVSVVSSCWCGVVSSCQCGVVMSVWCRHVGVEWCRHAVSHVSAVAMASCTACPCCVFQSVEDFASVEKADEIKVSCTALLGNVLLGRPSVLPVFGDLCLAVSHGEPPFSRRTRYVCLTCMSGCWCLLPSVGNSS